MSPSFVFFAVTLPFLTQSCGNVPTSCSSDLNWAVSTGKNDHPSWYPNFQSVTGTALSSASSEDMVLYWYCTSTNPNGNCDNLDIPCGRECYPSSGTSSGTGTALNVVTMNLFWWNLFGQRGGENFFSVFSGYGPYDLFFFQECDSVDHIRNGLGYDLTTYGPAHSVALAWSNSRFTLITRGWEDVAEDRSDQYYGTRCIVWARLRDTVTGQVVFAASHHGPLPVDTGGKTGGSTVAYRINQVISYNKGSGDTVILGGDFNAHDWFTTVTTLQNTYGYNKRASDWVDHIFTMGSNLDATPTVSILKNTGSDHDGVKLTWSGGLSGGSSSGTGSATPAPTTASCGNIPSSCSNDLSWAMSSGRYNYQYYYPNFQDVTGVSLTSASQDDMVAYWICTNQNVNGNCDGLEMPCGWTGSGSCSGQTFEIDESTGAGDKSDLFWILLAAGVACIFCVLCVAIVVFVSKRRHKSAVGDDQLELRSDEQIQGVDDQMIELEESIEVDMEIQLQETDGAVETSA